MSKRISFTSNKGGVGKTTFALNYAYYLSGLGFNVDFVNLDPQDGARDFFKSNNENIRYLETEQSSTRADYVIYDHPPGATLSHNAQGLVVLIANPSRLAIKDAFKAINDGIFKRYIVVLNRFEQNSKGHRLLKSDLHNLIVKNNKIKRESRCLMLSIRAERKAVQNVENEGFTLFNAEAEHTKIYNFDKTKNEFTAFFNSLTKRLDNR